MDYPKIVPLYNGVGDAVKIVVLYEIDVVEIVEPYQRTTEKKITMKELGWAREALERELADSKRVRHVELEELN